jgi:hypothetical protein
MPLPSSVAFLIAASFSLGKASTLILYSSNCFSFSAIALSLSNYCFSISWRNSSNSLYKL